MSESKETICKKRKLTEETQESKATPAPVHLILVKNGDNKIYWLVCSKQEWDDEKIAEKYPFLVAKTKQKWNLIPDECAEEFGKWNLERLKEASPDLFHGDDDYMVIGIHACRTE
jgi:hypothetical protein